MKTFAIKGMLFLFSLIMAFHVLVIIKVIPYTIVWAGKLNSDLEMYRFEAISLLLNAIFLLAVLIEVNFIKITIPKKFFSGLFWAMSFLFFLNTIGNLFSKNHLELIIFTPITALLCVFSIIVAVTNKTT
jgi:hypothetical protein